MCKVSAPKLPPAPAPAPPQPVEATKPAQLDIDPGKTRGRTGRPGGIRNSLRIEPKSGLNYPQATSGIRG